MKRKDARQSPAVKESTTKKKWLKPLFKDLRLGFEITMYIHNR